MKKAVIFDIDGVLAEKSPERDYREYDKVHLDKHIEVNWWIMYSLLQKYKNPDREDNQIIFITGRKELCREKTSTFIRNAPFSFQEIIIPPETIGRLIHSGLIKEGDKTHKIGIRYLEHLPTINLDDFEYHCKLFMRADNDHRKAVVLKKEIYDNHIKGKYDVVACFDDDPEICEMYTKEGLLTFEVKR